MSHHGRKVLVVVLVVVVERKVLVLEGRQKGRGRGTRGKEKPAGFLLPKSMLQALRKKKNEDESFKPKLNDSSSREDFRNAYKKGTGGFRCITFQT